VVLPTPDRQLYFYRSFIANLDLKRVEEHHPVQPLQGPVLPLPNFFHHCVGNLGNHIGRDQHPVHIFEIALDLLHRHPACIHGDDLVVESAKAPLALRDQLRFEAAVPVAGYFDLDAPFVGQDPLAARTVAVVALMLRLVCDLVVVQMLG